MSQYRNPPIVEAICEFRFSHDTKWDPTITGLLYEKLKKEFPIKESRLEQEIQIKGDQKGIKHRIIPTQKAVFLKENRLSLVQIGQNLLAINCLKPYPGWDAFRPQIKQAYDAISEITEITGIDRIALVYIDKMDIPEKQIDMKDYFKFYPQLGGELPQTHNNFVIGCDFPYNKNRDICKLQLTSALPEKKENLAFLLTTEYFLARKKSIPPAEAMDWINEAHTVLKGMFKGCITEKMENIFGRID
jgi:uncharacterized protein (TIGR04255 family)